MNHHRSVPRRDRQVACPADQGEGTYLQHLTFSLESSPPTEAFQEEKGPREKSLRCKKKGRHRLTTYLKQKTASRSPYREASLQLQRLRPLPQQAQLLRAVQRRQRQPFTLR